MKKIIFFGLIALSNILFHLSAQAQPTNEKNQPHKINVTISINKIFGINTINQTYEIDGYLVASWQDQSIKNKPKTGTLTYENNGIDNATENGAWIPAFEFINIIGERLIANRRFIISESGTVIYNERFHATFSNDMDFRSFPFDKQTFTIELEAFSYDNNVLVFDRAEAFLEETKSQKLDEWNIEHKPKVKISESSYQHLDSSEKTVFSRVTVNIEAQRKPHYYIWQFILPLSLILAASWSVFWIKEFADRLATAVTMMLTVVAYTFFTSSILPKLPYTTFIERMIILGYISIFASVLVIVFVMIHESKGKAMDKVILHCRYLFPCAFIALMITLLGINNSL